MNINKQYNVRSFVIVSTSVLSTKVRQTTVSQNRYLIFTIGHELTEKDLL